MAEGLTRSTLRTPERQLGTQSGRMYREARKLERKGFGGAAQQVAAAAAQQKLAEPQGIRSADTAIAAAPLVERAQTQQAALAAGMQPGDTRQKLFADMKAAAAGGLAGEAGAQSLAGFRSRASQLGVAPERFEATASGKLGIDLRSIAAPAATATTPAATTPAAVPLSDVPLGPRLPAATPKPAPVGMIGGKPASEVLAGMRTAAATVEGTPSRAEATGASGDLSSFLKGVRSLTSPEGGDLMRGAAVDELNRQRVAAGKPKLDRDTVLNTMLQQSRSESADRASVNTKVRGLLEAPAMSADPTLAASFNAAAAKPTAPAEPLPIPLADKPLGPFRPTSAPVGTKTNLRAEPIRGELDAALRARTYKPSAFEVSPAAAALREMASGERTKSAPEAARDRSVEAASAWIRNLGRRIAVSRQGTAFEGSAPDKFLRRER